MLLNYITSFTEKETGKVHTRTDMASDLLFLDYLYNHLDYLNETKEDKRVYTTSEGMYTSIQGFQIEPCQDGTMYIYVPEGFYTVDIKSIPIIK